MLRGGIDNISNFNFINYLERLIKIQNNGKYSQTVLLKKEILEIKHLNNRTWLLEKAEELERQ